MPLLLAGAAIPTRAGPHAAAAAAPAAAGAGSVLLGSRMDHSFVVLGNGKQRAAPGARGGGSGAAAADGGPAAGVRGAMDGSFVMLPSAAASIYAGGAGGGGGGGGGGGSGSDGAPIRISLPLRIILGRRSGGSGAGDCVLQLLRLDVGASPIAGGGGGGGGRDGGGGGGGCPLSSIASAGRRRAPGGWPTRLLGSANAALVLLLAQAFQPLVADVAEPLLAMLGLTACLASHGPPGGLHHLRGQLTLAAWLPGWSHGWGVVHLGDFSLASTALAATRYLLRRFAPKFFHMLRCAGAAIPVTASYARTKVLAKRLSESKEGAELVELAFARLQKTAAGRRSGGSSRGSGGSQAVGLPTVSAQALMEQLWQSQHRFAAARLCHLLTDFHETPPLGRLLVLAERITIVMPLLVVGCGPNAQGRQNRLLSASLELPGKGAGGQQSMQCTEGRLAGRQQDLPGGEVPSISAGSMATEAAEERRQLAAAAWEHLPGNSLAAVCSAEVGLAGGSVWQRPLALALRASWLLLHFAPLLLAGPLLYALSRYTGERRLRSTIWQMLRYALERCGAAFIKWGQWSATREDIFPEDMCRCLGRLHDRAPTHSYRETCDAVFHHLGRPVEDIFEHFDSQPCASGSIAQVHRATLKAAEGSHLVDVAVKVRHPAVALQIWQDFQIIAALVDFAHRLPYLRWLNLRQSVEQFSHTMTAQADLRFEARNLLRFHANFQGLHQVAIPRLVPHLVSEGVIVESFERGAPLHKFLHSHSTLNTQACMAEQLFASKRSQGLLAFSSLVGQIAAVGVDTYLKMMLTDNFVHTDLHPGNILARMTDTAAACGAEAGRQGKLQLVLLDFGLAEELSPRVRHHFLSFISMIGLGNGRAAARHLLAFSWPQRQQCPSPKELADDMDNLFIRNCNLAVSQIDLNHILKQVLGLCRKHEVTINATYASLVIAVCVLVGFANALDPKLSIMDGAVPCLFLYNLTGRVIGQVYG
eukprot:SM000020S06076  [mRNA]  locus=s20:890226:896111:+ [translate_table: standard]